MAGKEQRDSYSVKEFADRTGMSQSTVHRRIKDGSLPVAQPSGPGMRIVIPVDAIERAIAARASQHDTSNEAHGTNPSQSSDTGENAEREKFRDERPAGPEPRWKQQFPQEF